MNLILFKPTLLKEKPLNTFFNDFLKLLNTIFIYTFINYIKKGLFAGITLKNFFANLKQKYNCYRSLKYNKTQESDN